MSDIVGILIAVVIATFMVPKVMGIAANSHETAIAVATAEQQRTLITATTSYVTQNNAAVAAVATATVPAVITVAMLQAPTVALLDASFSATNPYGQTWEVQVLEPAAGNLQALVLSKGGPALNDRVAAKVASLVGATGGIIPMNDTTIYGTGSTAAVGTYSGWSVPLTYYQGTSGGHLAALLSFNNSQLSNGYLYRDAVPGQPERNTMNTPILLGAGTVQIEGVSCTQPGALGRSGTGGVLSCDGGAWKPSGSAFWRDPVASFGLLPACNTQSTNQTRVVQTPMVGNGPRAYTCSASGAWLPLGVDDSGDLLVPGSLNTNRLDGSLLVVPVGVEGATCPQNGRLARTSTGLLLSCNSLVWVGANSASGLGYGQRWQNVPRSFAAWYQNTTAKPIMVAAVSNGFSTWAYLTYYLSDGANSVNGYTTCYDTCHLSFVVPPNHYYAFYAGGSGLSTLAVRELR